MGFLNMGQKSRIEEAEEKVDIAAHMVELKSALDKRDEEIAAALEELKGKVTAKADSADIAATINRLDELGKKAQDMSAEMLELQQKMARPIGAGTQQGKSLGEIIIESESFKAMAGGKQRSASIEVKSITSDPASAGVLVEPQRLPGILGPPDQALLVRDLLMPGTTISNAIEYTREKLFTNAAATVAELAQKPQSDITFDMTSTTVKTLAHWMYASRQILDDAAQLATYINGRLVYGLKYAEEQQLLLGDGTGQNLLGIIPQATAFDESLVTTLAVATPNKMDILRAAMLQVQLALYPPSGLVLNPIDWASITLTKDANGNYMVANPQSTLSQILWSLPVAASMSMTQGEFLVGAFTLGAQIFDREQANIAISYEDRDNFVKNAVTIRAEERLALAVYRPAAFVHGSFTPATP